MAQNIKRFFLRFRTPALAVLVLFVCISLVGAGLYYALQNRRPPSSSWQPIPSAGSAPMSGRAISESEEDALNVKIRLGQGKAQRNLAVPVPIATGEPLSEEEIAALLARLPELTGDPSDQADFRPAGDPIPPPRTGETIQESFPPAPEEVAPPEVASGPLQVLRFSPEGEIPVAPFINITFNQPMAPLATVGQLAAESVPVRIDPPLPGTWQWLGTRTLSFRYASELIDRLPKATTYRVTVPAGTTSMTGGVLEQAVEWTFTTPPPKVTQTFPTNEPQPRDPIFFIHFDQRIDPEAVLNNIQVTAGGNRIDLRLIGEEEVRAEEKTKWLIEDAVDGRWLAFRAQELLPADAEVSVVIKEGTPSAEGPLTTTEAQSYSFRTYAPLSIVEHGCSWGGNRCPPLTPFFIRFNNPIDAAAYKDEFLRIEPELPGASVNIYSNTIQINGASKGQTTYSIFVDGAIQDIFGQALGEPETLTFRVGPAEPRLFGSDKLFVTLDPYAEKPVYNVFTINQPRLELQIYAVQPSDWPAFKEYLREYMYTDLTPTIPGQLVMEKTLPVESPADTLTEVGIDLSEVMDGDFGHFIVVVRPPKGILEKESDIIWQTVHTWVQVTQIGLDAFIDHSDMVVWTTELKDGAPLANITVEAGESGVQVVTGDDGTIRFPIPSTATYLTASRGADTAMLPKSSYYWGEDRWELIPPSDEIRWYVFDDRSMYRPGEEIHLKGWIRQVGGKQDGDVGLAGGVDSVQYWLIDPQGNELASGDTGVNALGGFDLNFTLPEEVNLGYAQLNLRAQGNLGSVYNSEYYHSFQIQEFRRPEFEVKARNETTGPYFAGGSAVVAVEAAYYAGGPLPGADVTWQVSSTPGSYAPPNWPDFTFGAWSPWWYGWRAEAEMWPYPGGETTYETFYGQTDATGEHYLDISFDISGEPKPISILAEATVMDVNRQAWTGSTSLLVHPAELYVGIRSERYFVQRGVPIRVDVIVTDLDGNPIPDRPVEVRAARLEWKLRNGEWGEEEVDVQTCSVGSASEPVTCTFETPLGGSYRITAVVTDDMGRANQSQFTRWVSGGELPPARNVEQERVDLIPDKDSYQPGDVAEILVQSPFSPAEGLLTVARSGILYTERFTIEDGTAILNIPIEEAHIPNLNIQVDLSGASSRSDDKGEPLDGAPPRPAFAHGEMTLDIPPLQRTLSLSLNPAVSELEPGGETTLDVLLTDANGNPVPDAELAVVVVDEAVLALTNYELRDPLEVFYLTRPAYLDSSYARESIVLANPLELAQENAGRVVAEEAVMEKGVAYDTASALPVEAPAAAPAGDMAREAEMGMGGAVQQPAPIRVRIDFNPLAVFAPEVRSDANGAASIPVKVPDNLTRYRVMVVAVDEGGNRFGKGETNLTARLPLMVRPSAPRFLNFGDVFELPVVLQNQTDEPMQVQVAIRALNLALTSENGVLVSVPPRDRVEVRFPAAADMAGTAHFQVAAVSGGFADAASIELPVYTPATTEAFAVYGVIDDGAVAQPVASPSGVFPQYGGLEISTSSTALQALTDAVLYLVSYPFECSEQLASRILGIAALRDVLDAFDAEGLPSPEEIEEAVARDIEMLQKIQNPDGGFPYWRRGQVSIPYNTVHVTHALIRASMKGYAVPQEMYQSALDYLRNIENYYPSYYGQETRRTISAYALYVRSLGGDTDAAKAERLLNEPGLEKISLDALGWLWPVIENEGTLEDIRRHVSNRAVETAGAANFTTTYDDQNYLLLGSARRTDAILLDALMEDDPESDLIPKLVNGLLAHRKRGRWGNTQENTFVLLALDRYFRTYEAQTPEFTARIWLGDTYAGSHSFTGRTTERSEIDIPMAYLEGEGLQDLILSKEGVGRLYYRLGMRYAPSDLQLDPLEMGFVVQRVYEAVDDPQDVTYESDGSVHIRAGARVRVRLTMVAQNRRYHVALVDHLPAGLEVINPDLAVMGGLPPEEQNPEKRTWWSWWWPWYEHENMRDERVEVFTTLLWDGVHEYSYIARATTPGTFIVPPAKAEEMYSPEVFGRTGSAVVVVE